GPEHDLQKAVGAVGRLLREAADPPARRERDAAGLGGELASGGAKKRRLAGAVTADPADPRSRRDLHGRVGDEKPSRQTGGNIADGEHARFSPQRSPNATPPRDNRGTRLHGDHAQTRN